MSQVTISAQGLLFDMDGVLISSIGSVNRCWRQWAIHYGVPDAENYQVEHGVRALDVVKKLRPDIDPAEGLKVIEDMELADTADLIVLPGARALLQSLPMERWAIVTSATYRLMLGRLAAAELPVPDRLVSGDRVENGKPHPEPYIRGAEMIQALPADCIVVEDAPSGVGAGKAAGCRVLAVLGTHSEADLRRAGADWVTRSLEGVSAVPADAGLEVRFDAI